MRNVTVLVLLVLNFVLGIPHFLLALGFFINAGNNEYLSITRYLASLYVYIAMIMVQAVDFCVVICSCVHGSRKRRRAVVMPAAVSRFVITNMTPKILGMLLLVNIGSTLLYFYIAGMWIVAFMREQNVFVDIYLFSLLASVFANIVVAIWVFAGKNEKQKTGTSVVSKENDAENFKG